MDPLTEGGGVVGVDPLHLRRRCRVGCPHSRGLRWGRAGRQAAEPTRGLLMPGLVVGSSPDPGCVGCPRSRGLMMGASRKASRRANEGLDDARTRGGFLPGPRRDPSRLHPGRTAIIVVPAGCCASTTTIGTKAHVLPMWGFELTQTTVGPSRPSESGAAPWAGPVGGDVTGMWTEPAECEAGRLKPNWRWRDEGKAVQAVRDWGAAGANPVGGDVTEARTPGRPRLGLPRGPARSEGCVERQWLCCEKAPRPCM